MFVNMELTFYYLSQKRNIADGLGKWVIMKFATGNLIAKRNSAGSADAVRGFRKVI